MQRREAKREQYNLTEISPTENEHQEEKDNVTKVFQSAEMISTVHVTPICQDSDDEMGVVAKKDRSMDVQSSSSKGSKVEQDKVARNKPGGARLSKAALDILTNTRLKVQGKKKFSKSNRARGKACKTGGNSCSRDGGKSKGRKGRL